VNILHGLRSAFPPTALSPDRAARLLSLNEMRTCPVSTVDGSISFHHQHSVDC
jgi:hypothetical protein